MKIIHLASEMTKFSTQMRAEGKKIALVPTMGALHEGHLSLIDEAKKRAEIVVVSIFVNPTQFGPSEDFAAYPRQMDADAEACKARGADAIFSPTRSEIYADNASTFVIEEEVSANLCGKSRPNHFRGVATVVSILFNIVRPDIAVFGEKDAQQLSVIRRIVRDLFFPVEIVGVPIVRENGGLAMSSRNKYLSSIQFDNAAQLHKALTAGKRLVEEGICSVDRVKAEIVNQLSKVSRIRIIYVEIVDAETSLPMNEIISGKSRAAIAVWIDQTRLIDNIVL